MRIGIDIDGVVYPFVEMFKGYVELMTGKTLPMPTSWGWEGWEIPKEEIEKYYQEAVAGGMLYRFGPPIAGAKEGIKSLKDKGHEIRFITARPNEKWMHERTMSWFKDWGIKGDMVLFLKDKSEAAKELDVFVDDRPEHVLEVHYANPDVHCYLFEACHNKVNDIALNLQVSGWADFLERVDKLEVKEPKDKVIEGYTRDYALTKFEEYLKRVMDGGVKQGYADMNWALPEGKNANHKANYASIFRHVSQASCKNYKDTDGVSHRAKAAFRLLMDEFRDEHGLIHTLDQE